MVEKDQMSLLDVMGTMAESTKVAAETRPKSKQVRRAKLAHPAQAADVPEETPQQAPAERTDEHQESSSTASPTVDPTPILPKAEAAAAGQTKKPKPGKAPSAAKKAEGGSLETEKASKAFSGPDMSAADELMDALSLDRFLCFSLYSANHAMNRVYRPLLQQLGLTYPQYLAMVVLWEKNDQLVGDIGSRLHLESNTITPLLKRLESLGLISRERSLKDERQVRVKLTRKGHALKQKTKGFAGCILDASGISLEDLSALQEKISVLRNNMLKAQEKSDTA
ncbi:MarR family transcriptional regulator [Roseibium sp. CAU 1637]|uniref:MarR family transcriptional regulator n=2 Tax=Roseibium limicola TaxID=2816037 RepID=A0A939ELH4_9HYPH|nr:MarR family transcriptional regulator [Roseibium limicola]